MTNQAADQVERELSAILSPSGLMPLGWFELEGKPALLIGNIGSSMWPSFSNSSQLADGEPDPLNRWTVEIMSTLVQSFGPGSVSEVRYPFGEPNWPFQNYAQEALGISHSPIGLLIHPEYGLWMAFRAVLIMAESFQVSRSEPAARPCDTCIDKPCLNTCPIDAFTVENYDYVSCKSHVASKPGRTCLNGGCQARQACPVGRDHIYARPHQAFHMKAFV